MNRKRKLKQMRRFLLQHGEITMDVKREPDWFTEKEVMWSNILTLTL